MLKCPLVHIWNVKAVFHSNVMKIVIEIKLMMNILPYCAALTADFIILLHTLFIIYSKIT